MKFIEKLAKWSKRILLVALLSVSLFGGVSLLGETEVFSAPHNLDFAEWCTNNFDNGVEIYEAYRVLTFDIMYENDVFDYWQKPIETVNLGKGDCEDAAILFTALLPFDLENVKIVWGYVFNEEGNMGKHVWCELESKTGQEYYVEGYKHNWSGIMLKDHDTDFRARQEIFSLTQWEYFEVLTILSDLEFYNSRLHEHVINFLPFLDFKDLTQSVPYSIFSKLHGMLIREIVFAD